MSPEKSSFGCAQSSATEYTSSAWLPLRSATSRPRFALTRSASHGACVAGVVRYAVWRGCAGSDRSTTTTPPAGLEPSSNRPTEESP
jgi:hypothetical protein